MAQRVIQPHNPLLTVKELADLLRCNKSTVYRLIKRRELPYIKVGSDYRFPLNAINDWIRDSTRQ